jgi:hypothetical protein
MDGFKNTTKTCYSMGGYAKGGPKGAAKISKVMGEFKSGALHSGSKKGPEVTNPKQAVAIALSEARKAGAKIPMKKAEGVRVMTPAERDMSREAEAFRAAATQTKKPVSQRGQEQRMQGQQRGVSVNKKPAATTMTKDGLDADWQRGKTPTYEAPSAPYKKGGKVKPAMSERTAQKYKAAMASRPNREPRITPATVNTIKTAIADAVSSAVPAQAAPAMAPMAMGAPAMKKGGSVHKKADGGMASSIRSAKDYNASDKDFVGARSAQLSKMVGKAEGGMADIKQDKAMVKAAVHKHERSMHPGKPLTKLRKGGMAC